MESGLVAWLFVSQANEVLSLRLASSVHLDGH